MPKDIHNTKYINKVKYINKISILIIYYYITNILLIKYITIIFSSKLKYYLFTSENVYIDEVSGKLCSHNNMYILYLLY